MRRIPYAIIILIFLSALFSCTPSPPADPEIGRILRFAVSEGIQKGAFHRLADGGANEYECDGYKASDGLTYVVGTAVTDGSGEIESINLTEFRYQGSLGRYEYESNGSENTAYVTGEKVECINLALDGYPYIDATEDDFIGYIIFSDGKELEYPITLQYNDDGNFSGNIRFRFADRDLSTWVQTGSFDQNTKAESLEVFQKGLLIEGNAFDPSLFEVAILYSNGWVKTVNGEGYVRLEEEDGIVNRNDAVVAEAYGIKERYSPSIVPAEKYIRSAEIVQNRHYSEGYQFQPYDFTVYGTMNDGTRADLGLAVSFDSEGDTVVVGSTVSVTVPIGENRTPEKITYEIQCDGIARIYPYRIPSLIVYNDYGSEINSPGGVIAINITNGTESSENISKESFTNVDVNYGYLNSQVAINATVRYGVSYPYNVPKEAEYRTNAIKIPSSIQGNKIVSVDLIQNHVFAVGDAFDPSRYSCSLTFMDGSQLEVPYEKVSDYVWVYGPDTPLKIGDTATLTVKYSADTTVFNTTYSTEFPIAIINN